MSLVLDPFVFFYDVTPVTTTASTSRTPRAEKRGFTPRMDVTELDTGFSIHLDLPGVHKEDIHLSVKDHVLTVSGKRAPPHPEVDKTKKASEKVYGAFERVVRLPETVDAEGVQARLENGVLELVVPKKPVEEPKRIQID
ncbi:hypothetical protein HDU96_001797 [Phlyctochytrium bullatum]|nr:hypothetical protein HDU96_001797 [Phlyctochytrium bullatum]